ncbi:hypothetical protein FBU59_001499 [Linderina macrospora]|uniref:Uncharacterized protein n=1 Tax=Linderina macrospora TaxID=4868 RepID=A0ACC1JDT3_9FUNG|nr:hypothetical protein FBU59_001499 [Linderina macrospora]
MAIHYNQNVILQCVSTGMVSPILTLRKVEKGSVAVGAHHTNDRFSEVQGDPVSQLHKVAFEVNMSCNADFPPCMMTQDAQGGFVGTYLTCMSDVVGLNKTSDGRQPMSEASPAGNGRKQAKEAAAPAGTTMWAEDVGDTAVWTIVGTDCAIHRFDYPSTAEILERVRNAPAVSAGLPQSQQSQSQQQQQTSAAPSSASRGRRNSRQSASRQYQAQSYYPQQHQQLLHQPMSLDMLVGDSTFAAAAAAAAAIGGTDFAAANSMDSSTFAAAMYGMGLTGIPDTLSNQLLSPQTMSPSSASSSSAHHTADHHHHGGRRNTINIGQLNASHGAGDNSHIPVVFKMSVQHPPSISPSALLENSSGCAERSLVTLHGQNFAPDMTVVFDGQQSVFTEFKSPELIVCFGPLSSDFAATDSPHQHTSSSATDDEGFEDMYARGGEKQRQSPDSDCLPPPSAARSMTTDTLQTLLSDAADSVHHAPHRRASSAESTVSSATVNSSGAERQLAAGGKTESLAKFATRNAGGQAASTIKVPVYLSCGNGAGPTYKTGQFYTLHC